MKAYGILMMEHRVIERMLSVLADRSSSMRNEGKADTAFLLQVADFLRSYVDLIHHGKEEEILFRDLAKKNMSDEHSSIMARLVEEHGISRGNVRRLRSSCGRYDGGADDALDEILGIVGEILRLYASHIETEDKRFFIPVSAYFTDQELARMLEDFRRFDMKAGPEKYVRMVEALERG